MREILFRGKRVDNGEWVFGDFVKPCNIVYVSKGYDEVLNQNDVEICNDDAVIPETVGQFTGLTDKNGTKIFEGDICRFYGDDGEYSDYRVIWDTETCRFKVIDNRGCDDDFDRYFRENSEVIGGIHDNSEMIEGIEV